MDRISESMDETTVYASGGGYVCIRQISSDSQDIVAIPPYMVGQVIQRMGEVKAEIELDECVDTNEELDAVSRYNAATGLLHGLGLISGQACNELREMALDAMIDRAAEVAEDE